MAQQIYWPLNKDAREIRVITLLPSPIFSAPIVCALEVVSLNGDDISYKALSYTWGDPHSITPITINGVEHPITVNLALALRHIRDHFDEVVLWADAICINQPDLSERSHQVQLMRDIYSGANSVVVWLGEAHDDSDMAMKLIKRWSTNETDEGSDVSSAFDEARDAPDEDPWPALQKLFQRSWWTRVWIIQEVAFAREVHFRCGYQELSWEEFTVGFKTLLGRRYLLVGNRDSYADSFPKTLRAPAAIILQRDPQSDYSSDEYYSSEDSSDENYDGENSRNEHSGGEDSSGTVSGNKYIFNSKAENDIDENHIGEDSSDQDSSSKDTSDITHDDKHSSVSSDADRNNLWDLMNTFATFEATDPRDKIYALFGLATDAEDFGVPDYLKPAEELYREVAITLIRRDSSLEVLCHAGTSTERGQTLDLPSWVPNWANRNSGHPLSVFEFYAAGDRKAAFRFSDDGETLHARGIICDKISSLESVPSSEVAQEEPLWKSFLCNYEQQVYRTGITQLQALFRTLMFDYRPVNHNRLKVGSQPFFDAAAAFLYELGVRNRSDSQHRQLPQVSPSKDPDYIISLLQWKGESKNGRSDQTILEPFLGKADSDSFVEWPRERDMERGSKYFPDYSIHRRRMSNFCELFRTDQGFMGIAMPGAKRNDLICVLFGCNVPLILREVESHYVLVGSSFVLGLMDGEAIQDLEDGKVSLSEFDIS